MVIRVDMIQTVGIAVAMFMIGNLIVNKTKFLKRYCIPPAVVGGLVFTFMHLMGVLTGLYSFVFDQTMRNFFMIGFFSTIGFSASFRIVKQGGTAIIILLISSIVMLVVQDIWGIGISRAFGLNPLLGMCAGSISLMGGSGTSAALAPILGANGAEGALIVAIASAIFGLIVADLVAGPIAKHLIDKKCLVQKAEESDMAGECQEADYSKFQVKADEIIKISDFSKGFFYIMIVMAFGSVISLLLKNAGLVFPAYIGAIFASTVFRNIADVKDSTLPLSGINAIGKVFLNIFLSMTIMSLEIWKISGIALPLMVILAGQVIICVLFTVFVVFNLLGKDYDSAVMSAGFFGYAIGVVPNSVVSMTAVVDKYGRPSPKAFFTVPIVGGFLIDLFLSLIVITHMNLILSGIL
jgi:ESS family glutamate:Na+ symporter